MPLAVSFKLATETEEEFAELCAIETERTIFIQRLKDTRYWAYSNYGGNDYPGYGETRLEAVKDYITDNILATFGII